MQATFLSKVLNDEKSHLNEDHLFKITQLLDLLPEETEYLFLLRSHAISDSKERKEFLNKKIEKWRKEKLLRVDTATVDHARLRDEMAYLFNPACMLVHAALMIPIYEKTPRRLMPLLGLNEAQLKECLVVLEKNEFLELGKDPFIIKDVKVRFPHYGPDHPLMRLHQQVVKTHLVQRLRQTSEADKESFFVTFTGNATTFIEIKKRFREFIQDVQKIGFESQAEEVFQLSFDLARWF